ncbi:serine--tRNA ligase [Maritalea myrionectae]|uniref:serine--tRNA ligase n=1 Tax=Maritalea myrionectae TaxID=454601 RepID=UPI0003F5C4A2|nr:serine--tRNA ligase [Maritalea myrionectae]
MFDIKWIRANPDLFDRSLARRGAEPMAEALVALDDERKKTVQQLNEWQGTRNASSKQIGQAKAQGDEEKARALLAEVADLKAKVQAGEDQEREQTAELNRILAGLPNLLLDDVPDGEDEDANVERHKVGEPKRFNFEPKEHYELGEALGHMDFETAAKIAGSRFVVLKSDIARLERALGQYMLDLHTREHGFTEVVAPLLVRPEALFGTGQLPKFAEDAFQTTDDRWLIPTSEVSLTNLVRESMLSKEELPLRFTSLTPCFRSEAGSAGRDTRGMLRQHQFYKVEMVAVTAPDKSLDEHERMLGCAEAVMKGLEIPYRVMRLCAGDMGATMQRTYDIEAWLPGQDTYREISSVSVAGDYQARRMNARYRDEDGKAQYVHTLNGSGVATGRALIAVMENYQQEDGSIAVPDVLQPYMAGQTVISAS